MPRLIDFIGAVLLVFRQPQRPPITPEMEYDLLGRDNQPTQPVAKIYASGRPIHPAISHIGYVPERENE